MNSKAWLILVTIGLVSSCSEPPHPHLRSDNTVANSIGRHHEEQLFPLSESQWLPKKRYPWDSKHSALFPAITKEHFRCKGCDTHPIHVVQRPSGEPVHYLDCAGISQHSLPLRNGQEFIYPILIKLLNYLQERLNKKVIITAGHRCPQHHNYVDPSPKSPNTKHMIGAQVAFYVEGMENAPEKVLHLIQDYYLHHPDYADKTSYNTFKRYSGETDVSMQPWFNKEIFIKIYGSNEGRDNDNQHTHPYLSIQVRYDPEQKKNVSYSWHDAHRNFYRW